MTQAEDGIVNASGVSSPVPDSSARHHHYTLVILLLVYTMNVVDRNVLNIVLQPIKLELGLSDTQLGFLSGFSFAFFYATLGIPIAMWADRSSRRNIIAIAITLFSVATFVCGLATSYVQLLVARFFVAFGEAGTAPSSHSMITDMYPAHRRGAALGFYSLGANVGVLIGLPLAGLVSQYYGWRAVFFVVAIPGLILALVLRFTIKEPVRGHADDASVSSDAPRFRDVCKHLWSQRAFRHLITGIMLVTLNTYALSVWYPSFLIRSYQMSPAEVGTTFALLIGLLGGIGTFFAGWLADRLGKRDVRWNFWSLAIAQIVSVPFWILTYISMDKNTTLLLFIIPAFVYTFYMPTTLAMTHALTPVRMRSQASAIFLLILAFVGGGLGPQLVGYFSDVLAPAYGAESLRYALLIMVFFWLWSILHFLLATRTLKEDIARVRA